MMITKTKLGVIGGSGLYEIDGLEDTRWEKVESPWGEPSDEFFMGTCGGTELVFLPRHGRDHRLSPSFINYRANIDAMKRVGVTDIVSLSACGSFQDDLPPGTFVCVDQFFDRTNARARSFFETGLIAHVSMAHPVCSRLQRVAFDACEALGVPAHLGGTYLAMEGPQFSTMAESVAYKSWDCDVIGMTNMPEAKLAREAEIPYTTIAMVTDFDCWHPSHDNVDVATVVGFLQQNGENARAVIKQIAQKLSGPREVSPLHIETCLDVALINPNLASDVEATKGLDAILARYLRDNE